MSGRFGATVEIDRPIEEVFDFLAAGVNDPKFSKRVLEIKQTTDGPPGVGTVFASTVKDAGMKSRREIKLTEFERPTKLRWTEIKLLEGLALRSARKGEDEFVQAIKAAVEAS